MNKPKKNLNQTWRLHGMPVYVIERKPLSLPISDIGPWDDIERPGTWTWKKPNV